MVDFTPESVIVVGSIHWQAILVYEGKEE